MKSIDAVVASDFVSLEDLCAKFKSYLMKVWYYDSEEADFVIATDFAEPYLAPYIDYEYEQDITIDGKEYEVYIGTSAFENVGMFPDDDDPVFEFYTLFDKATIQDDSLATYCKARKVYVLSEG